MREVYGDTRFQQWDGRLKLKVSKRLHVKKEADGMLVSRAKPADMTEPQLRIPQAGT